MGEFTIVEASKILNITPEGVRYKVKNGTLDSVKKGGRVYIKLNKEEYQNEFDSTRKDTTKEYQNRQKEYIDFLKSQIDELKAKNEKLEAKVQELQELRATEIERIYKEKDSYFKSILELLNTKVLSQPQTATTQTTTKTKEYQSEHQEAEIVETDVDEVSNDFIELNEFLKNRGFATSKERKKYWKRFNNKIDNINILKREDGKIYIKKSVDFSEVIELN